MNEHQANGSTGTIGLNRPPAAEHLAGTPSAPLAKSLLLRIEEAAYLLAVSTRTVKRLVASRTLRTVRIGRSVRIRRAELERWLETGCPLPGPRRRGLRSHAVEDGTA